jgi:hypothetical protein
MGGVMQFTNSESRARRLRARNLLLIVVFLLTLMVGTATNPSPDKLRPLLLAMSLAICAKLVIEFAFGLPMYFLGYVRLQPTERAARLRVFIVMFGLVALLLYLFYAGVGANA